MIGVTRAGRSRAIRRSSSAVSTAASKRPSAVAILRSFSERMRGCTDWTAAAATCVGCSTWSTGNGAVSSSRADGLAQRVPARQQRHRRRSGSRARPSRRASRRGCPAGRRARSRACPRPRSSMKCSTLIAATLHVPHLALEGLLRLEQDRGLQFRRHLGDGRIRQLRASPQGRRRAPPRPVPPARLRPRSTSASATRFTNDPEDGAALVRGVTPARR